MAELRAENDVGPNRVVANAAYLLATNAYRIILNMAIFFVIARVLGAEELGRYAFALSYATLFSVAVHLASTTSSSAKSPSTRPKGRATSPSR